jgi:hypothetical protein
MPAAAQLRDQGEFPFIIRMFLLSSERVSQSTSPSTWLEQDKFCKCTDIFHREHQSRGVITKDVLLIKDAWGTEWDPGGYGWMRYAHVLKELTVGLWSLTKSEWIDAGAFEP